MDNFRPIILGKYHHHSFTIFLDSGSPKNIVSDQTYDRYFNSIPLTFHSLPPLSGIGGQSLNLRGRFTLPLEINGQIIYEEFMVMENISLAGQLLMGFPAMLRNKMVIDTIKDGVFMNTHFQKFHRTTSLNNSSDQEYHINLESEVRNSHRK